MFAYVVISLSNNTDKEITQHLSYTHVIAINVFALRDRIFSLCMLSVQMRLTEVVRGRTGDEQQESRQAEREGVRWRDFLLRGSLTLTMEPQPATRIALSDSVSHSLLPLYSLFFSPSLFSPILSLSLSLCLLSVSPAQSKCTTTTSLLQLTPSYLTSALFPDKRV